MTDHRAEIRDYIDGLTRQAIEDAGRRETERHDVRGPRRMRQYAALTAMAIAVVAGVAVISTGGPGSDRSVTVTGTGLFVPPVSREGDRTLLPLVFPDGSSVDLVYPESEDLARLGFQPEAAVIYSPYGNGPDRPDSASPQPCCGRGLTIRRGTIHNVMGGRTPTKAYTGANGQEVPFFDSTVTDAPASDLPELAFQFGSWTVLAYDYPGSDPRGTRMTDEQRAVFAASLDGREDDQGFLVLEPRQPLCLQTVIDGPNATLGPSGPAADPVMLFLQPLSHLQGDVISEKTARGYGVLHRSGYTSLLLPGNQLELSLPDSLHRLQDDIEITNLKQEPRWRC